MIRRVVLAEDNFLIREGVRGMLGGTPSIEVVASCGDLDEALAAIDDLLPDVVLTDIRMPPHRRDEGILIAAHCRKRHPDSTPKPATSGRCSPRAPRAAVTC